MFFCYVSSGMDCGERGLRKCFWIGYGIRVGVVIGVICMFLVEMVWVCVLSWRGVVSRGGFWWCGMVVVDVGFERGFSIVIGW